MDSIGKIGPDATAIFVDTIVHIIEVLDTLYFAHCAGIIPLISDVALIDQADTNNGSVMRGTIAFGGDPAWENVTKGVLGLLDGTLEAGYVLWEPNWAINNFGYEYDYTVSE